MSFLLFSCYCFRSRSLGASMIDFVGLILIIICFFDELLQARSKEEGYRDEESEESCEGSKQA